MSKESKNNPPQETNPQSDLNMDLKQIQELIRFVSKSGVHEVQLEQGEFKIVIKTRGENEGAVAYAPQPAPQPVAAPAPASAPAPAAPAMASAPAPAPVAAKGKTETIKSPMIGTFYQRPAPDKDVFVKPGDTISKGQVVGIIEAMKLFNEIEAEISGRVVEILVQDATPVEYDQPLLVVEVA